MSQRLTPGEQAPDFTLTDAAGEEVTLSGLLSLIHISEPTRRS